MAERLMNVIADASGLTGGDILVCAEYGRVEIEDSDDDQVRLQVRVEGSGEGSAQPTEAAARAIDETHLYTFVHAEHGRLIVRVWHSTLGFTSPGGQPAWVSVRVQVPARGSYRVTVEAFHSAIAVRRLSVAGATIRGNVGDKLKGIPGFIGATELDNVVLVGDVDIDNLIGIPGVRAPVPPNMSGLAAPILVKARVASSCSLRAVTGGDINIAILPAPELGLRVTGESNAGRVSVVVDGGVIGDTTGNAAFPVRRSLSSAAFDTKAVKIDVRATSSHGNVSIASLPAAPLAPRPNGRSTSLRTLQ